MRTSPLEKAVLYGVLCVLALLVFVVADFPIVMLGTTITAASLAAVLLIAARRQRRKLRSNHPELSGDLLFIIPTYSEYVLMRPSTQWGGLTPPYRLISRSEDPQEAAISLMKEVGLLDRDIFRINQSNYFRFRWLGSRVVYTGLHVDREAYLHVSGRRQSRWMEDKMVYADREGIAPVARKLLYHRARFSLREKSKLTPVESRYYRAATEESLLNWPQVAEG